jgi:hypothetical protein
VSRLRAPGAEHDPDNGPGDDDHDGDADRHRNMVIAK